MAVPPETTRDVVADHSLVAGDDVLDGAGEDVAVVGEAGGEGRAVVEDVFRHGFRPFELILKGLDVFPHLDDLLLLLWEGEVLPFADLLHGEGFRVLGGCRDRFGGMDVVGADGSNSSFC